MNQQSKISTDILGKIRAQDRKTLTDIYKEVYPMVKHHILKNNGSEDDAQDIFQDAFYVLIKKCEDAEFELTSKISTFIVGVARNLWLKKLSQKSIDLKKYQNEKEFEGITEDDSQMVLANKRMKACIEALGEPCKTIIVEFYFLQTSMKEIAEKLHYTNANNAKNQKYKCFKRLKKLFTNASERE